MNIADLKMFAKCDYTAFEMVKKVESYYQDKAQQQKQENMRQKTLLDFFKM